MTSLIKMGLSRGMAKIVCVHLKFNKLSGLSMWIWDNLDSEFPRNSLLLIAFMVANYTESKLL